MTTRHRSAHGAWRPSRSAVPLRLHPRAREAALRMLPHVAEGTLPRAGTQRLPRLQKGCIATEFWPSDVLPGRSEEHTSELQSLMRISYAVFCLKKKKHHITKAFINTHNTTI